MEWADLLPNFKGVVRSLDKPVWLDELARMCEQRFSSTYRSDMGVRKFYEVKTANRKEHGNEAFPRYLGFASSLIASNRT